MDTASIDIGGIDLGCRNYESMVSFYEDKLRLISKQKNASEAVFGFVGTIGDLTLHPLSSLSSSCKSALDHIALKVSSRQVLGRFLHHLIISQTPILGAIDHGDSEAIYLEDPDGNKIEIIHDKRRVHDQRMKAPDSVSLPFDYEGVYYSSDLPEKPFSFPQDTTIGHVGIKVCNLAKQKEFYEKLLGFSESGNNLKIQLGCNRRPHLLSLKQARETVCDHSSHTLTITYQNCQKIESALNNLKAAGISVTETERGYLVKDYENNRIQLLLSS